MARYDVVRGKNLEQTIDEVRAAIQSLDVAVLSRVNGAYVNTDEWLSPVVIELLQSLSHLPDPLTEEAIFSSPGWQRFEDHYSGLLAERATFAERIIRNGQRDAVDLAEPNTRKLVLAMGLPPVEPWVPAPPKGTRYRVVGFDQRGIAIVKTFPPLSEEAKKRIRERTIRELNLLLDAPPSVSRQARQVFTQNVRIEIELTTSMVKTRALSRARNNVMDAFRQGAVDIYKANSKVLTEDWEWASRKDAGVCKICMFLDGQRFPNDQPFALRHINCRCFPLPVIPGDKSNRIRAADWLYNSRREVQDLVLGSPEAGAAYRRGDVTLKDFVKLVRDQQWGDHYQEVGFQQAMENAALRRSGKQRGV